MARTWLGVVVAARAAAWNARLAIIVRSRAALWGLLLYKSAQPAHLRQELVPGVQLSVVYANLAPTVP